MMSDPFDPFQGQEDWARQAERRAKRAERRRRLGALFRLRSERARTTVWLVSAVAAAVLLAAALPTIRTYLPGGAAYADSSSADSATDYATQAVPSGVSVTTTASAAPTDPFEGTPAATYPKGEAGITLPAATAVTGFTAVQVDAALQQVRKALIAGRLDQKMLVGHDPSAFFALLAPNSAKNIKGWFDSTNFSIVATWIAPGAHLDPAEDVRVSGRVTFASAAVEGLQTLRITTNFVWVYAFTGNAEHPLAAEHDEIRWDFYAGGRLAAADKGLWVGHAQGYMALIDCVAAKNGLLAPFDPATATPRTGGTAEDSDAFLKADHTLAIGDDCDPSPSPSLSPSSSLGG